MPRQLKPSSVLRGDCSQRLVHSLVQSLEELSPEQLQALWVDEAERRDHEMESGKVAGAPGDNVFLRIERKYGKYCCRMSFILSRYRQVCTGAARQSLELYDSLPSKKTRISEFWLLHTKHVSRFIGLLVGEPCACQAQLITAADRYATGIL